MCRSTDFPHLRPSSAGDRLDLEAFCVRFSSPRCTPVPDPFPESLTLLYLPSIAGHALEIDGSKVRPDRPTFLTLHRVVTARGRSGDVVYGSRDRVRAGPGLRFEVYLGEEKALKGSFRRDEGQEWRLECACALEREILAGADADARWVSEVCVAAEGHVAMCERVEMVARKRSRKSNRGFYGLEDIPEERESDSESDGGRRCCCCEGECGSEGREEEEEEEGADGEDWEVNTEGVRWAVDVGIWVACLGVGYLVSKASAKSLRRRRLLR
ncbi:uncharacterized protein LOC115748022 [Rhodamnia argentea]|uniref:Uncharacterized protein LOC115748022 n=1 Tax=Rhodamnia argentea TaxID=178133 RepID=A0ABM3H8D3_9MYRT|nr:uncharacterized protein LOC115748022 [Rhodamnia argentea]